MAIKNSILETIGKTPLIKLNRLNDTQADIYLKLENFNPGGSTKDRAAMNMIEVAEKKGLLTKNTTIIEATSGNTGIALAMICAVKGYNLIIVMPDTMSVERQLLLKAYGATIITTDGKKGMKECLKKVDELKELYDDVFIPDQFTNFANPDAHYNSTALEIINDTDKNLDIFICGTGTGGSFTGVSRRLKEEIEGVKTYSVEPLNSPLLTKGYSGPHKIQGMGMSAGFVPIVYDGTLADEVLTVDCNDAFEMTRQLARLEGVLLGISSGAVVSAALEVARREENHGKKIVVLCTDTGERYLSSGVFDN